ncbi:MAG: N-acetylneuraminate synthase family protein, partial [Lewinella sp.]|nr:N-acetylneuraminate synthase family protein [Lewinella sp.]
DFIKYQLYSGDTLVSRLESPVRNQHFKKFELSREKYVELAELCRSAGVGFMASVWDIDYIEWIDPYLPIYKIGSGDLTAYPVLREIARLGKPIILSTGLATLQEVLETVAYLQHLDDRYLNPNFLSILQCTSMYPIPDADAHLSVMQSYKAVTGLPVGYSDHTEGGEALALAVAMGAEILEFHFTDAREGKTFRDHKVSLTQAEVLALIDRIKAIKLLQGDPLKRPLPVEGDHVITFRRAVYPKVDIHAGTCIEAKHLICLRPNHGIDARSYDQLIGKTALVDLAAHQKLEWEFFQ